MEKMSVNEENCMSVVCHPYLPMYLTGGNEGKLLAWKHKQSSALAQFKTPDKYVHEFSRCVLSVLVVGKAPT